LLWETNKIELTANAYGLKIAIKCQKKNHFKEIKKELIIY